jgi:hypothetical protein
MTRGRIPAALAAAGVLLALTACGGDDDKGAATTTTAPPAAANDPATTEHASTETTGTETTGTVDPEFADYCALAIELDQQQSLPTAEQMKAILAAAPAEIADSAKTVVDAYIAAGANDFTVFTKFPDEMSAITAFEEQHCGIASDDEAPPDPAVVSIDPAATRVDVHATDFHFQFEPPTAAGRYSFVMANGGAEPHMMILAQLEPGATLEEAMASEGEEGVVHEFESIPSGPGGESVVTADLTAGHWVLVCPLPSQANNMQPHAALGMVHEWDVT